MESLHAATPIPLRSSEHAHTKSVRRAVLPSAVRVVIGSMVHALGAPGTTRDHPHGAGQAPGTIDFPESAAIAKRPPPRRALVKQCPGRAFAVTAHGRRGSSAAYTQPHRADHGSEYSGSEQPSEAGATAHRDPVCVPRGGGVHAKVRVESSPHGCARAALPWSRHRDRRCGRTGDGASRLPRHVRGQVSSGRPST